MRRYLISLRKKEILRYAIAIFCFALLLYVNFLNVPAKKSAYPYVFIVEEGEPLSIISEKLKEEDLIRSRSFFNITSLVFGHSNSMKSGTYIFESPQSAYSIVKRLSDGDYGLDIIKITFPEGSTREEIADIASRRLPAFDTQSFLLETKEGYLFPDTYNFFETATAQDVKKQLEGVFFEKIDEYKKDIKESDRTQEEILIMASIIEKEANTPESRRIVSGILWKRIDMDMPLQVDATFVYGIGKGTFDLTKDDLVEDGPYNTYARRGLPPTPISNPGIDSIDAAIHPEETDYLYFLTGNDGQMYYAKTFEQHVQNKKEYIY